MDEKRYYWSPVVQWKFEDGQIIIENFTFKGFPIELFLETYYFLQNAQGRTEEELKDYCNQLKGKNSKITTMFLNDLIKKRILIMSLNEPKELFACQSRFVEGDYAEDYFFHKENVENYVNEKLNRFSIAENKDFIELEVTKQLPDFIENRRSSRSFDKNKIVTFSKFSNFINAMGQRRDGEKIRYIYPSAGGIYPLNIYLYIKKDRVEGIEEGIYKYNPEKKGLYLLSRLEKIDKNAHFFTNSDIFNDSAFSIFISYDGELNMHKYKETGYFFGIIECGILLSILSYSAEFFGLGCCIIGEMDFDKIKSAFEFNTNEVFLQSLEIGIRK
ncbi:SagB/ThcOx family dehydrogenase [Bacillus sp. SI2]|uniref:SagB/ThcOx family dehydrogenase n=1 Tax=Bacillus sp. SI2 TaxID=3077323 RepID=UPI0028ED2C06|nr:SagB/ThcOx family dehydrogenase [Bacillus sp. SI2]WNV20984.1 SagB/ThcOx family dehydrogenase [Bacillus sp. SI2]